MLKNYFNIAIRNFRRYLGYTTINVAGLAVGLATAIFILLWVTDELSYDSFHKNKSTSYKVWHNAHYTDGSIKTFPSTPAPLAPAAKAEIPEIEYAIRMDWGTELLFEYENTSLMESGIWADPDLFKIFTFPILKGNPEKPMPGAQDIAVSEAMAKKYFADEDPIGKVFRVSEQLDVKVTAVFQNVPANSSMQFDFVLPFETFEKQRPWMVGKWENSSNQTFIKLHESAAVEEVNNKIAITNPVNSLRTE